MLQIYAQISEEDSFGKYNFFKEHNLEITETEMSHTFYNQRSSVLRKSTAPSTRVHFNFLVISPLKQVAIFYLTVIKKKFPNIYYGYDSTAFCLIKCNSLLESGKRYIIYGKLSKNKLFFVDCLSFEELDYRSLCYMLL